MANVKKLLYKRATCTKNALIYSNGEMAFEQNELMKQGIINEVLTVQKILLMLF